MKTSNQVCQVHHYFSTGRALEGQEAQVFEALSEHVAVERAAVLATQRDAAAAFSDKYRFVARRSLQQMEVHQNGR